MTLNAPDVHLLIFDLRLKASDEAVLMAEIITSAQRDTFLVSEADIADFALIAQPFTPFLRLVL